MTSRILCGATAVFSVTTALLGTQAANSSDRLMKNASVISLVPFPLSATRFQQPNGHVLPSDDDIRQILRQRVDAQGTGVGIVVGVIDASGWFEELKARVAPARERQSARRERRQSHGTDEPEADRIER
jgi:hypothetical protein